MIGDFLYSLLPRDQALLEPFWVQRLVAQAAANLISNIILPNDRILVLTNIAGALAPGAAQIARSISIQIVDSVRFSSANAIVLQQDFFRPAPGAAQTVGFTWSGRVMLPPGATLQANAQFDAGVAVNTLNVSFAGQIIPRGNLTVAVL